MRVQNKVTIPLRGGMDIRETGSVENSKMPGCPRHPTNTDNHLCAAHAKSIHTRIRQLQLPHSTLPDIEYICYVYASTTCGYSSTTNQPM
jgi:hypothetical protein